MIKQIWLLLLVHVTVSHLEAQNLPTTVTSPASATARALPIYNPTPSANYLRTLIPVMPTTDSAKVTSNAWADTVNITTQYFDSLNRPLQTVIKQASPSKNDYVSPNTYDEFGRVINSYLPYGQTTGNNNDGHFKANQFANDSSFYKTNFPSEQINYSQATYDATPLKRMLKTTGPGNSWTGAGVGISNTWRANAATDSVRLWTIAISTEDDVPATTTMYAAGSLSIQETTDERGVKTVVYKDELGRTVLSKQQIAASPTTGHYGWLCTYYVYDEMNHVRVVIPPKAVDALNTSSGNWNLTTNPSIKTGLCFSYFYDARGRVIMKYIPGKGKNYFAYDLFDRIVMTQDPNLRQTNQWAFLLYDGQGRPWRSGVITNTALKDSIIAQAARSTAYPTLAGTYTVTSETYFDDYSWISGGAPNSTLVTTNINSTNFNTSYNTYPDYAQQITQSARIRGMVTGSKRIILNTSNYLYNVPLYDEHGRVIQIKETNYTGGTDVLTQQYTFVGRILRTHLYQQKSGTNAQTHTLLTKYSYDHEGRLKTIIKNIDNIGDKTISANRYNELGQLQSKVLGSGIDSMAYSYNIRGWLTGINKNFVDTYSSATNYFGEDLFYDYGFTNNQLNGAIAGVKWKAGGDTIARAYGFGYDNAKRLSKADFSQNIRNTTTWTNASVDFSVSGLTYDAGSNILSMNQKGLLIGSSATIDSLSYQYFANSNQLQKVGDAITDASPLGDFKDSALATDYTYDVNGNITKDYNRHMHTTANGNGAVYNLLDKPDSMVIANKATLYYYYDAAGVKLRKQVNDYTTGKTLNYLYIDGFVYLNDTLQYVQTEEGRIRWSTVGSQSSFIYDYYLRDHLNNVRTVLTEQKDTSFYPPASLETASLATEKLYYSGEDSGRVNKNTVSGYPADTYTNPNDYIQQLSGSGFKIGTGIVLKVMAGDKYNIRVSSWYNTNGATPGTPVNPLPGLLAALAGGISGTGATHGITGSQLQSSGVLTPGATNFLNSRTYTTTIPKAYLNWILFDDQFKMVSSSSGAQQVGADNTFTPMTQNGLSAAKNGYLYVYVSNETPNINVYFDNLQVTHIKGPLLQEQSYYPFGLQMAGISDRALGKTDSKNKFNGGVELEEDYGVNLYSTFYRQYDPQIGRFGGVDLFSERNIGMSVYQFGINNPISYNDPWGDKESLPSIEEIIDRLWNSQFGGFWSSDTPATAFLYGDRGTEDFFGSGGSSGAGFMDNLAGAYSFIQSKSAAGNEVLNFDLSQASNGDYYASSGYYMPSKGMDGGVTMIKDLGHLGVNGLSYNWGNMGIAFGGSKGESNGWEKAGTIVETADISFETTEQGIIGVQRLGNAVGGTAYTILKAGKLGKNIGAGLAVAGALVTVGDAVINGPKLHHAVDLAIDAGIYYISASVPVAGWIVGGAWFLTNYIYEQYHDNKSITEDLLDN